MRSLRRAVKRNDAIAWAKSFLDAMPDAEHQGEPLTATEAGTETGPAESSADNWEARSQA
jgi:hypothetical protein